MRWLITSCCLLLVGAPEVDAASVSTRKAKSGGSADSGLAVQTSRIERKLVGLDYDKDFAHTLTDGDVETCYKRGETNEICITSHPKSAFASKVFFSAKAPETDQEVTFFEGTVWDLLELTTKGWKDDERESWYSSAKQSIIDGAQKYVGDQHGRHLELGLRRPLATFLITPSAPEGQDQGQVATTGAYASDNLGLTRAQLVAQLASAGVQLSPQKSLSEPPTKWAYKDQAGRAVILKVAAGDLVIDATIFGPTAGDDAASKEWLAEVINVLGVTTPDWQPNERADLLMGTMQKVQQAHGAASSEHRNRSLEIGGGGGLMAVTISASGSK